MTLLTVLLMTAAAQAISPCRPPPEPTKQPWKSGETTVTLSHDGTLRVSGKGAMKDYSSNRCGTQSPWHNALWHRAVTQVTDVVIEEGVTHIGDFAFTGRHELKSITIPASVTSIGENVFSGSSLTSITVAADNTHYSSEDGVLFNKDKTTLIQYPTEKQQDAYTIPDGVVTIAENAFAWGTLTSVTIPNSVMFIGDHAFIACENLRSITIPNSVISIGDRAFEYSGLISATIPGSVTSIGYRAFAKCSDLTSVTIPGGAMKAGEQDLTDSENDMVKGKSYGKARSARVRKGLGSEVFAECFNLMSVTIGDGATFIGDAMFSTCPKLTSITIPNSVTSIGSDAFARSGLTSVTIPNSVTFIENDAFYGCFNLKSVIFRNPKIIKFGERHIFYGADIDYLYIPAKNLYLNSDFYKITADMGFYSPYTAIACDMKTGHGLTFFIAIALILSIAISVIIIKSRKSSGRKLKILKVTAISLSALLLITVYSGYTYATTFTLNIHANPKEGGTVSPQAGKQKYRAVTEVRATAKPNDGYVFTGWSGASTYTSEETTVIVDDIQTLTANFKRLEPRTASKEP